MQIGDFTLVNEEKVHRAIYGTVTQGGMNKGGVGEDAKPEAILAEYDRLGGYIKKGKYKVKMGSFYDFKGRKPRSKPEVVFVLRALMGEKVEVKDGESIPLEVKAQETLEAKKKKAGKRADGKKVAVQVDEEEETEDEE